MNTPSPIASQLLALIAEYRKRVGSFIRAAAAKYGTEVSIAAWRSGELSKDGSLDDAHETRFSFHGAGCRVISDEGELEFDFGPDSRHDGFDGWRLWIFAESQKDKYPQFQRLEVVESILGELVTDGIVIRPHWMPSPHLCYLKIEKEIP